MMSKKHYVQFAEMFKSEHNSGLNVGTDDNKSGYQAALYVVIIKTADIFASDNPNFDRSRFLNACGLTSK